MNASAALKLVLRILREPSLKKHVNTMNYGTCAEEWEIEKVAVKCCHYSGLHVFNMIKETLDRSGLG